MRIQPTAVHQAPILDPGAWTRAAFSGPADWTYTLAPKIVRELETARTIVREKRKRWRLWPLADADIEALDFFESLYSRTAYEDYPEPERRRHLVRLWLKCA